MNDYEMGRADAAKAIRQAAEQMLPGSNPEWLKPGARLRAHEVREWLVEWAAKTAEHGEVLA